MPITFDCTCGKTLRVPDEHAGRRVKCPACNTVGTVPLPEPQFEVVEDEPQFEVVENHAPTRAAPAKGKAAHDDEDEDDTRGYGVAKQSRAEERAEEEERERRERARKKWRKREAREARARRQDNSGQSLEGRVLNGGIAGGLLAMIVAVVWFVLGLMNDWIFFYPPILFVIGLVAFFKGLAGEE